MVGRSTKLPNYTTKPSKPYSKFNMTTTLQQLISQSLATREKKAITSWHPSKLGSCLTGAYLERQGVAPDEDFDDRTLRVFSCGKFFEDWACAQLQATGTAFETQVRIEWPEMDVTGYADLLLDDIVYEIKSKNSRAFWYMVGNSRRQGEGPNRQHQQQLWTYLRVLKKERGEIVYISKDDLAIQQYPVFLNDNELESEVMAQLEVLNKAWRDQVPPPVTHDDDSWQAKYCRWHTQCKALTQSN